MPRRCQLYEHARNCSGTLKTENPVQRGTPDPPLAHVLVGLGPPERAPILHPCGIHGHAADMDVLPSPTQCVAEQTGNLHESCRMRALQEGTSEKVAMAMVPAFPGGIIPHVSTLALSRAQRFLDELFTRSCPPSIRADAIRAFSPSGGTPPYNDRGDTAQDQVIKAFAAMVGTWLDQVQGLGQPLPIACFEAEQALVPVNSPASHLVGHAQNQWLELQHLEPTEATPQGPRPELQSTPETEKGPAQGPEPGPRTGPALAWPRPRQYLKPLWSHLLAVLEAFSLAVRRVLGDYLK
ncbi:ral guanine nucleotide dissociation stimulator-like [Myotis lucifugus]|uniref:ral guanine nucleotide dissociation stimulator-like n=1 Tax=Myotis lucifugus TaxID=59463 RepID=UPI000CCC2B3C|nr:ral guanine nucleotide dissociation stimulator-like [Myotis lucifugus]